MPRISRFITEFTLPSNPKIIWSAEFIHQHASMESGKVKPIVFQIKSGPDAGKFVDVQHLTCCRLRYKGQTPFLTGYAPCSMGDVYNWRKGIHYSLQRALEKGGYCTLEKRGGKMLVVSRKPIYDEVTTAFWAEVFKKADSTPPAASEPTAGPAAAWTAEAVRPMHGMGAVCDDAQHPRTQSAKRTEIADDPHHIVSRVVSSAYSGTVPAENHSGLGYAGMD